MKESQIVNGIVRSFEESGFTVATEVPNLHRSADIAAVDVEGNIWIVECKVSHISQAINQCKTHKLSADKVFIGIPFHSIREKSLNKIRDAGLGLIYLMPDGSVVMKINEPILGNPWKITKEKLRQRILEVQ